MIEFKGRAPALASAAPRVREDKPRSSLRLPHRDAVPAALRQTGSGRRLRQL